MGKNVIKLRDDEGVPLGITLVARKRRVLVVRGLRWPLLFWSTDSAIEWAYDLQARAARAEHEGHTCLTVSPLRSLSTRNAVRLGFAVRQILLGGPTYFTQESHGDLFTVIDPGDYACPHVELAEPDAA